jgi:hypothetical protein
MDREWLEELDQHINVLKRTAAELGRLGEEKDCPAVERNAKRIHACVKMLELNVSDLLADRSPP